MAPARPHFRTMEEYIRTFPENVQRILQSLRQAIKATAPEAVETISYQIPTFKLKGNLVHFAAFTNHIGFYPDPSAIEAFRDQLSPYSFSKGAIRFPIHEPIPLDLVKKMVAYRVKQHLKQ